MVKNNYTFKSEVWLYPGVSAWHFVSLPKNDAKRIKKDFGSVSRGWGSLRVLVSVRQTKWDTSIFPDKKSETYVLPIKTAVRKKEGIMVGDFVNFSITIKTSEQPTSVAIRKKKSFYKK